MANRGEVKMNFNRAVLGRINDVVRDSIEEVFSGEILDDAQDLSPKDSGNNSRKIATETHRLSEEQGGGVLAELYTQSGYGGYLELGHRVHLKGDAIGDPSGEVVEGRPYLYPAFAKNIPRLLPLVKRNLSVKVDKL